MWIKAVVGIGIAAALAIGGWQLTHAIGDHFATHERNKVRITELESDLRLAQRDLAAERLAQKLDAQSNLESFEKADWACRDTIKSVIAATKIAPVPIKEYVHVEKQVSVPGECPVYRFPPMYRVRDVQAAGTDANPSTQMPARNEGDNRR
jgi:hypothetical protein